MAFPDGLAGEEDVSMSRIPRQWRIAGAGLLLGFFALLSSLAHAEEEPLMADGVSLDAMTSSVSEGDFALVELSAGLEGLKVSSFRTKIAAVEQIAHSGADSVPYILGALLGGRVFIRRDDKALVIGDRDEEQGGYKLSDLQSQKERGHVPTSALKKVIINNRMRSMLRKEIARLSISASNPFEREAAVVALYDSLNSDTVLLLRERLRQEKNVRVMRALQTAIALADLHFSEKEIQLVAIETLSGNMHSEVRNQLFALVSEDAEELDATVKVAAERALARIDGVRRIYQWIETVFFGLSLGFVLVLAAIGLAITFGVMGVINMAHGELIMLGAYATWLVQQSMPNNIEASLFVAVPVAFLVAAGAGLIIERGVVRFLYGRPLETLLATFGVSLILQQTVRTIFSPLNRAVSTPRWMSGQLIINDALAFTFNRIYIIFFSLFVFFAVVFVLQFTTLGLQIRAVAQNRNMARAMGVRSGLIDAITFGLGSGVAGLAGVALSQLTNVGPNLGQSHIVDSFMVVVFGGVGNLWGTLVAGLSLGIANKFLEPFAGAVLAKVAVLVFIIMFIQKRPRGLFPQRGRSAEA